MNPLITKTIEKIEQHVKLTEGDKWCISIAIGYSVLEALEYSKKNPNYNLKGGDSVDENTIGNELNKN